MRNTYTWVLRDYLSKTFTQTRRDAHLTQARFAERLMMDTRSYSDIEHAHSLCCTLTFIIFLCNICDDPIALIHDLRQILSDISEGKYDDDRQHNRLNDQNRDAYHAS